ncbi:MAG TPA: energy-coupling factor transporter ATPase [Pseudoneobacillus sp.]|nr:energy-coupling factor transporter ATPase [Pseudoneobacillus sp.]
MAYLEINNLSFTYPTATSPAIQNVTLQVEKGQFVVLFGSSGSGKSTLLRLLKKDIQPHGEQTGEIFVNGQNINETEGYSNQVGFVFQDPENQVVSDDVLHEIVFGLENIGVSANEMRSRVAEMVHYFGAESLLHRKTQELSGGMKQQINLASVLLMQPEILLLDEPTAQLDPVSSREFLDILKRLNEEFGMTIILAEHRLDEVFTMADQMVMMENGKMINSGSPSELIEDIWESSNKAYVPVIPSLYFSVTKRENRKNIPLSVKDARKWINNLKIQTEGNHFLSEKVMNKQKILEVKELFYHYRKEDDFVLKECNFTLFDSEIYALLGGNGTGKSTFLKILAGILKPKRGKITLFDKALQAWKSNEMARTVGYLPQNPKLFFIHDTIEMEIQETMNKWRITSREEVNQLLKRLGIDHLLNNHPYDLSGGELQKAALACILLRKPKILLLDEPTKGLDPVSKVSFAKILKEMHEEGLTVVMSTHDVEFAALYSTRCGMMFQGNITSENVPSEFFKGNFFYTTMVQRVFRNLKNNNEAVTIEEAMTLCGLATEE